MTLLDTDFYLHYFAFDAWRVAYARARLLASMSETTEAFGLLAQAMDELARLWSELDWEQIESDDDDPAGRVE